MSDDFDFSLDIINEPNEPKTVQECKFDEIIPFRIKEHQKLTAFDIRLINKKIEEEYTKLGESYDERVTLKEMDVQYLGEVKSVIDNYGLKEEHPSVAGFQTIIKDAGYTEENIDESLDTAKYQYEQAKSDFDDDMNSLYDRVYGTDHYPFKHEDAYVWDVSPNLDERRPQILSASTKEMLGSGYEDFCRKKFHDYMAELKERHSDRVKKAENLTSNITEENHDIQKE